MTRNDALSQRANETTEQLLAEGVCLSNGECEITDRVILQALQQVEREVLERVAKHLEGEAVKSRNFENKLMCKGQLEEASEIQTQRITEEAYAAWVREQQKELG